MQREIVDVSVIIPTYRAVATIDRALASVAAQSALPREVIVIDDGSDDGTFAKVQTWASRLGVSKLIAIQENHRGPGATRNRALSESTSEFVAFLDADDEWLPDKLEKSLAILHQTNSSIISHNYTMVCGEKILNINCAKSYRRNKNAFVGYFLRGYVATSTVVAKRSTLVAVGGFDPELPSGQDYELWLITLDSPDARFHIYEEPLTRYHITTNSISRKIELRRQCALNIAWRHAYRLRRHCRFPSWVLALRILIIHAQAAIGFLSQTRYGEMIRVCCFAPFNFISAFHKMSQTPVTRPDFLNNKYD